MNYFLYSTKFMAFKHACQLGVLPIFCHPLICSIVSGKSCSFYKKKPLLDIREKGSLFIIYFMSAYVCRI